MRLLIFGAQAIALGAYQAITTLYPTQGVEGFLVSAMGNNFPTLAGLPVKELLDFEQGMTADEKAICKILIATPENVMPEIESFLDEHGFTNHERLDSLKWAELMGAYYAKTEQFKTLKSIHTTPEDITDAITELQGDKPSNLQVFMAKFYKDKALTGSYEIPKYLTPIQVGAARCTERVADVLDNVGDNISEKNVNYSELTGLYWIWKNILDVEADRTVAQEDTQDYYGLAHYRRILQFEESELNLLKSNSVDVVLPYPMPYEPSIEEHPKRYLKDVDWKALLTALEELHPEYAKAFPDILKGQYMYNYNIIIARKEVLRDYCSWLFPILERTESLSEPKGWERADRYIGYMGEILETLYFMYNKDRFNIVHTGCRFLT